MDYKRLKEAESRFLNQYPGGFENPHMVTVAKRHRVTQLSEYTRETFKPRNFRDTDAILESMIKIVSRSSMVSVFEKPQFKAFIENLTPKEKNRFTGALKKRLHGDKETGFNELLEILLSARLAKWTIISVWPAYFNLLDDAFIKPTTTKNVIAQFGLTELTYRPLPSWNFYRDYLTALTSMRECVDITLAPSNPAFTGFLMMAMNPDYA